MTRVCGSRRKLSTHLASLPRVRPPGRVFRKRESRFSLSARMERVEPREKEAFSLVVETEVSSMSRSEGIFFILVVSPPPVILGEELSGFRYGRMYRSR